MHDSLFEKAKTNFQLLLGLYVVKVICTNDNRSRYNPIL